MDIDDIILLLAFNIISDEEAALFVLILDEERWVPEHLKYGQFDFNAFSDLEFVENFYFEKEGIYHLCEVMNLDKEFRSHTKLKWQNVEGICMLLQCLAYPNHLCELRPLFGHHVSEISVIEISVIINCMTDLLLKLHGNRLLQLDENDWFDPEDMARYVRNKGAVMHKVWGFLNGTVGPISQPVRDQQEFFSSHKRRHSLKY